MHFLDLKYQSELTNNEQILYAPQKNHVEFLAFIPILIISVGFFSFILGLLTLKGIFIWHELFVIALDALCLRQIYECSRDYFFSKVFLTEKNLIFFRFNKMFSIDYNEISKIYYKEGSRGPSYFAILLNSGKIYKFHFIQSKIFKQKIEEINNDMTYKNSFFWPSETFNIISLYFSKNNKNKKQIEQEIPEENSICWTIKPKRIYMLKPLSLVLFMTIVFLFFYKVVPDNSIIDKSIELVCSCAFGFLSISFIYKFITLKPILRLNDKGLYCRGIFIPWYYIDKFSTISIANNSTIIIELNHYDRVIDKFNPIQRRIVALNKISIGNVLPIAIYGTNLSQLEILKKLNDYLERARNM